MLRSFFSSIAGGSRILRNPLQRFLQSLESIGRLSTVLYEHTKGESRSR